MHVQRRVHKVRKLDETIWVYGAPKRPSSNVDALSARRLLLLPLPVPLLAAATAWPGARGVPMSDAEPTLSITLL